MFKGKLPLALAGALGLVAGLLAWQHVVRTERSIREKWQPTPIIVAGADIKQGTVLTMDLIKERPVPKQFITESMFSKKQLDMILGQKVATDIKPGDPIMWMHFESAKAEKPLSDVIQMRGRAISITVSKESSVSQFVRPSDHVDVLGTFRDPETREMVSVTLLQNVIVLTTGKITGNTNTALLDDTEKEYNEVTLLVLPEEAEILSLAQELGNLYLSLRNPDDVAPYEDRGRATIKTLITGERVQDLEKRRFHTIQVIRGQTSGSR
jgi:pilus assembly protein CpaB